MRDIEDVGFEGGVVGVREGDEGRGRGGEEVGGEVEAGEGDGVGWVGEGDEGAVHVDR